MSARLLNEMIQEFLVLVHPQLPVALPGGIVQHIDPDRVFGGLGLPALTTTVEPEAVDGGQTELLAPGVDRMVVPGHLHFIQEAPPGLPVFFGRPPVAQVTALDSLRGGKPGFFRKIGMDTPQPGLDELKSDRPLVGLQILGNGLVQRQKVFPVGVQVFELHQRCLVGADDGAAGLRQPDPLLLVCDLGVQSGQRRADRHALVLGSAKELEPEPLAT